MTCAELLAILPIILVSTFAVVVMLAAAFRRSHTLAATLTVIGLAAAVAGSWFAGIRSPLQVTPLLRVDPSAVFYTRLVLIAGLVVALLTHDYLKRRSGRPEEFYILLLLAIAGSLVLVASSHFASFFLGLEVLSVALYALIAYERSNRSGIEAGLKYLVLGASSAAFLLFGMALIYAESGGLDFAQVVRSRSVSAAVLPAGLALIIVGVGFKLALVPFHFWTPDVYQGAPAPAAAFIATVSKVSVLVVLLRLFRPLDLQPPDALFHVVAVVAVASMFTGNLLALMQSNVKRLLAYSSIAHLGYLLVAFMASGPLADAAAAYYLVAYAITMLGAFGVVGALSGADRDADALDDYQGLAWRRPWLAAVMVAMLLSLAGIPLTAGFVGKFYILAAGAASHLWWLVLILVVNSAIGLFYYLRVMVTMFASTAESAFQEAPSASLHKWGMKNAPLASIALASLTLLVLWLGVAPSALILAIAGFLAGGR